MVEMMMNQESNSSNTLIDVSSFMLFEASGDSEFDSNFCSTSHDDPVDSFALNPPYQRFLEDDDAQSCSYECGVHIEDEDMDLDFHIENEDDDDDVRSWSCSDNCKSVGWNSDMEEEEEEEDEDDVVEQGWNFGVNRCKKAKVDSVMEELKCQKDKDRLFWETCLAS
ncbi:uncharacterized protein LOC107812554 [Nicotiana tabacum]|uniref:Uncharacterized protein LOC107812554 n=1 Tax=Nicotiana tabacum TaxID=4097 RepID=A0A1S4BWD1_TOBAC|nr:PREDICTED: putative uncharacterized transmembrane protein DDB_G0290641 [Nicotiana tabacum]